MSEQIKELQHEHSEALKSIRSLEGDVARKVEMLNRTEFDLRTAKDNTETKSDEVGFQLSLELMKTWTKCQQYFEIHFFVRLSFLSNSYFWSGEIPESKRIYDDDIWLTPKWVKVSRAAYELRLVPWFKHQWDPQELNQSTLE